MEQYSEQSSKPLSQQSILKKAETLIYHRYIVAGWPSNLLNCFLLVTLSYLYTKNYKAVYTYHQVFFALKVLIQNKRTRWFMAGALRSAFVQGIVRVGYSPLFFYYELLIIGIWADLQLPFG